MVPAGRLRGLSLRDLPAGGAKSSEPGRRGRVRGLAEVRAFLSMLAAEAGASDPHGLARQLQIMMLGAIVAAVEGNRAAAAEARPVAALLVERSLTKVK